MDNIELMFPKIRSYSRTRVCQMSQYQFHADIRAQAPETIPVYEIPLLDARDYGHLNPFGKFRNR